SGQFRGALELDQRGVADGFDNVVFDGHVRGNHWQRVDQVAQNLVLGRPKGKAFALRRNRRKCPEAVKVLGGDRRCCCCATPRDIGRRMWPASARSWKIRGVVSRLSPLDVTRRRRKV